MINSIERFFKSTNNPIVISLLSKPAVNYSINSNKANDVDQFFLKPNWLSFNILYLSIKLLNLE